MAQIAAEIHSGSSVVRAEVVKTRRAFDALRASWDALFQRAYNASAPLSYDWLRTWLDVYGRQYLKDGDALRVICFWRGTELVGAMPLYLRRQQSIADGGAHLAFISTGERQDEEICPDYMDLLSLDEVKDRCVELAWKTVLNDLAGDFDRFDFRDVADHSGLVKWARHSGTSHDMQVVPRGVCPIADLHGGFESYLLRLSSNTRQQGRRLLRAGAQAGVKFEVASTPEEASEFFGEMVKLHQERWLAAGEPGCFASRSFESFHRQLAEQWGPSGRAVLSRLSLAGKTLAVKYGFRIGTKFDFYQSGIRMEEGSPIRSPGIVSFLMLMKWLADQGVTDFDFLRGSSAYKQRLATTVQPLVQVRQIRWTWRTGIGCAADLSFRCARRGRRMLQGHEQTPPQRGADA